MAWKIKNDKKIVGSGYDPFGPVVFNIQPGWALNETVSNKKHCNVEFMKKLGENC